MIIAVIGVDEEVVDRFGEVVRRGADEGTVTGSLRAQRIGTFNDRTHDDDARDRLIDVLGSVRNRHVDSPIKTRDVVFHRVTLNENGRGFDRVIHRDAVLCVGEGRLSRQLRLQLSGDLPESIIHVAVGSDIVIETIFNRVVAPSQGSRRRDYDVINSLRGDDLIAVGEVDESARRRTKSELPANVVDVFGQTRFYASPKGLSAIGEVRIKNHASAVPLAVYVLEFDVLVHLEDGVNLQVIRRHSDCINPIGTVKVNSLTTINSRHTFCRHNLDGRVVVLMDVLINLRIALRRSHREGFFVALKDVLRVGIIAEDTSRNDGVQERQTALLAVNRRAGFLVGREPDVIDDGAVDERRKRRVAVLVDVDRGTGNSRRIGDERVVEGDRTLTHVDRAALLDGRDGVVATTFRITIRERYAVDDRVAGVDVNNALVAGFVCGRDRYPLNVVR